MRTLYCTLVRANAAPVPAGTEVAVSIHVDTEPHAAAFVASVREPGRLWVQFDETTQQGHGADMTIQCEGQNWAGRIVTPVAQDEEGPAIRLQGGVVAPGGVIFIQDARFVTAQGDRWIWKGATDFALFMRYLNGEDISPLLEQRVAAGANLVRVLSMAHYMYQFYPQNYPQYYARLAEFTQVLRDVGLMLELTVFADAQVIMKSQAEQDAHWTQVISAVQGAQNVFLELVNEYKKNGVDPWRFTKPEGILCSQGSGLADEAGPQPGWDYHTWHGRRDWPKVLFSNEDMWYVGAGYGPQGHPTWAPRPIVADEPMGFHEVDIPGRRSTDPELARVLGLTALAYGCGGTFHSEAGLTSSPWGPTQLTCAAAFFKALNA